MGVYSSHLQTNDNKICIGEINFASYGIDESYTNIANIGKCNIVVYTKNEGKYIPHFHIEAVQTKFSCCVKIFEPEYFVHGAHRDKFYNLKEKESLNDFLKTPIKKDKNITRWMEIVNIWKTVYGIPSNVKYTDIQPDYTKLK